MIKNKNNFIEKNMGLVGVCVKKFLWSNYEYEDLFQTGCVGLVKAVNNFNDEYKVQFSTYAVPMIMGEIRRFLRDDGMIHVSRSIKEAIKTMQRYNQQYINKFGYEPSDDDLAKLIDIEIDKLQELKSINNQLTIEYMNKKIYDDGKAIYLKDKIYDKKDEYEENSINSILINDMLNILNKNEKEVIKKRYFEDETQGKISKQLGISQVQVSRLEKKSLNKMKKYLLN